MSQHGFFAETNRLEAFSDAVIAIIMTIMVLELHVPEEPTLAALVPLLPVFLSYFLSFVFLAIYWNNHHHLLHATTGVTGGILWANMHLLFWLSLIPFTTEWLGIHITESAPSVLYSIVLLGAAIAYFILTRLIILNQGKDSKLAQAIGGDAKGYISILLYLIAIGGSFIHTGISIACFVIVALMWIVPDRRIVKMHDHEGDHE
ncbi:MAG: DUF1211 domain-containing protein [Candidatus Peribacteraceae bacterium]|nr:DUF1211 domain-containing protein [Candidatus Peribacteraceae bacterium]